MLFGLCLLADVALTAVRIFGWDSGSFLALPAAGFPYAIAGTVVVGIALFASRAHWLGAVAAVVLVTQIVLVLPRFLPTEQAVAATAPRLRVATANVFVSRADWTAVVAFVRANRIDVLAIQEFDADGVRALEKAGLSRELPHQELHPEIDTSIYSRLPLTRSGLSPAATTWRQPMVEVSVGGRTVRIVGVHTAYPVGSPRKWQTDLTALAAEARKSNRNLVMIGDFNATLDHAPMRDLLATGLVDSHAELGHGLAPTWPATRVPLIQLDHVLHGPGLAAVRTAEQTIPRSDHRAVYAELALV